MAALPHLTVFNQPPAESGSFPVFRSLPPEIRLNVWRCVLQRQRIISIVLQSGPTPDAPTSDTLPRRRGGRQRREDAKNQGYCIVHEGYQTLSNLLWVTRESRLAALAFYRVHLPCWMRSGLTKHSRMKPAVFYFNPEYDVLHLKNAFLLADYDRQVPVFLHDLKRLYDPRKIGLLNLALEVTGPSYSGSFIAEPNLSALQPHIRAAFDETLAQLHQVLFIQAQRAGRYVLVPHGNPVHQFLMNSSFPIKSNGPNFIRLSPDPRSISDDLTRIIVETDPRVMVYIWQRLLRHCFGECIPTQSDNRILLTFDPNTVAESVCNHQEAKEWLQKKETGFVPESFKKNRPNEIMLGSQNTVAAAFGYWSFPVDAFGAVPDNATGRGLNASGQWRVMDLHTHKPDLVLLDLP